MTNDSSSSTTDLSGTLSERIEKRLRKVQERWREERLHTGLLPDSARRWAFVALAVAAVAAGFILALGLGWSVPGGRLDYAVRGEADVRVPLVLIVFTYLALAAIGGVVAVAARHEGWRLPAVARLCVGFIGAAIAAGCVTSGDAIRSGSANPEAIRILGWTGVACACAAVLLPPKAFGKRHEAAALLGGAPFLLALGCYAFAGTGSAGLAARNILASQMIGSMLGLDIAVALLFLWGAVESVRLGRDYGVAIATIGRALPWLLPVLLAAKLTWIVGGYTGLLPRWLGGDNSSWTLSGQDGWFGWGYAVLAVGLGSLWLLGGSKRGAPATGRLDGWVSLVVVGLGAAYLAYAIIGLLIDITLPWPWISIPAHLETASNRLVPPELSKSWPIVVTADLAPLLGLVLLRRRKNHPGGIFLLAFAAWAVPAAAYTTWGLVTNRLPPFNNTSLATIDTAVTVAVAVCALLWWTGHQRRVAPRAMLVALVVFTLVGHPGVLLPANWRGGSLVYLALIYPVVWQFLFRARTLNGHAPERPARVLGAIGLSSLLLVIAAISVAIGLTAPGRSSELTQYLDLVGRVFLMVPIAALLVAEVAVGDDARRKPSPVRVRREVAGA